jgi:hypothetical protein
MAAKSTTPKKKSAGAAKDAGVAAGVLPSHPVLWASAIFFVVLCVVFRAIILGGQTFVSPDATAPLGFVRVGEQALKAGVYPLWNPYVFTGMPSFASGAYNPLIYPPDWPVGFVQHLLPLPDVSWMLLYYFLAGLGTYLLARAWGAGQAAAIVAGVAFMATPNLVANGAHGHGSQMVNEAYLPWILWITSRLWQGGRWSDAAWLALLVGFQLLRGHVQIAYYGLLAVGLYSAFELVRRLAEKEGSRAVALRLVQLAVALGLGLALSAFFSLPIREYAHWSIRGDAGSGGVSYDYATGWSLGPLETLTFLVPGALGFGGATYWGTMPFTDFPNYMGIAILAAAFLALAAGKRRFYATYLLVLAGLALLVALGKHSAFYNFLFLHLPYFNKFRVPVMVLILMQLAVCVLAGLGLTALAEAAKDAKARGRLQLWTGILLGAAAIALLTGLAGDTWHATYAQAAAASRAGMDAGAIEQGYRDFVADLVRVSFFALVSLGGLFLMLRGRLAPAIAIGLVGVVTLFDLLPVDTRLMQGVLGAPRELSAASEKDDVVDFLLQRKQQEPEFRIFPVREFQSNRYAGFALASLGGYHAAKPRIYQAFLDADDRRAMQSPIAWRLLNVRYVVYPGLLPPGLGLTEVFRGQNDIVYRFEGALPRATVVPSFRIVPADRQIAVFTDTTSDPANVTWLTADPGVKPAPGGSVRIDAYGLNTVKLTSDTPGPSIVRLADLMFPGWEVTVDGAKAKALTADFMLRAVAVPAGHHAIVWTYHDAAFERGRAISLTAAALIALLFAASWFGGRKKAGPGGMAAASAAAGA